MNAANPSADNPNDPFNFRPDPETLQDIYRDACEDRYIDAWNDPYLTNLFDNARSAIDSANRSLQEIGNSTPDLSRYNSATFTNKTHDPYGSGSRPHVDPGDPTVGEEAVP